MTSLGWGFWTVTFFVALLFCSLDVGFAHYGQAVWQAGFCVFSLVMLNNKLRREVTND